MCKHFLFSDLDLLYLILNKLKKLVSLLVHKSEHPNLHCNWTGKGWYPHLHSVWRMKQQGLHKAEQPIATWHLPKVLSKYLVFWLSNQQELKFFVQFSILSRVTEKYQIHSNYHTIFHPVTLVFHIWHWNPMGFQICMQYINSDIYTKFDYIQTRHVGQLNLT